MMLSTIAAISEDFLIGTDAGLPWRLPADLRRFRAITAGKPVLMGRRTWELIGGPLKDRHNIVLTHRAGYSAQGCEVAHSLDEAFAKGRDAASRLGVDEVMVIGGAEVYREALPFCGRLYLTVVGGGPFVGYAYFPSELPAGCWQVVHEESHGTDLKNPHPHRFLILERGVAGGACIGHSLLACVKRPIPDPGTRLAPA